MQAEVIRVENIYGEHITVEIDYITDEDIIIWSIYHFTQPNDRGLINLSNGNQLVISNISDIHSRDIYGITYRYHKNDNWESTRFNFPTVSGYFRLGDENIKWFELSDVTG